jgi:spore germination protein KA
MNMSNGSGSTTDNSNIKLEKSMNQNINALRNLFNNDETIIFREFDSRQNIKLKFCAISVNGMIDKKIVDEYVIQPLMQADYNSIKTGGNVSTQNIIDILLKKVVINVDVKRASNLQQAIGEMVYGDTIILVDGVQELLIADTKGWAMRGIEEPLSERGIKGPREGFNESIITNISLIRRRIRNSELKFEFSDLGVRTKTKICICYINGLANDKIIQELKDRLNRIDFDGILYSQTIEEFISDAPLSIFKTIGTTERPDVVAGNLLEGRIALICDGTPFVITVPYLFVENFQSVDDYDNNYAFASFNRLLKYFAFFLTVSTPSLYIAVTTFHQELIPTPLLLSIATARTGVPLPTVVEAFAMLLGFELLREAGVRLPQPAGQAISIVGALVIGDAAVNARLISAPMVVIIALTVISSFLIPRMVAPLILIRMIFLVLGGFIGLYGYLFGIIGLFVYLMSIRSFGVPYTIGVGLIKPEMLKDTAVRVPWLYMKHRPRLITKNLKRKASNK